HVLRTTGQIEDSRREFETAVALAPNKPEFLRSLTESKRFAADDPHLAIMEGLARDIEALPENDRIELHFALAKAYGALGRHEAAFRHMAEGNALRRRQITYDESDALESFRRTQAVFTPELMFRHARLGDPSNLPIFIFGMARSG